MAGVLYELHSVFPTMSRRMRLVAKHGLHLFENGVDELKRTRALDHDIAVALETGHVLFGEATLLRRIDAHVSHSSETDSVATRD